MTRHEIEAARRIDALNIQVKRLREDLAGAQKEMNEMLYWQANLVDKLIEAGVLMEVKQARGAISLAYRQEGGR